MMQPETPVPPRLRSSFDELRRQLKAPPTFDAAPGELDAETLRFQLALRGRCHPRWLAKRFGGGDLSSVLDAVAADCETATGRDRRWFLRESVRRRVLQAKPKEAIVAALASIPVSESDGVTTALRRVYVKRAPNLDVLPAQDLRLLLTAQDWAQGRAPIAYDGRELRRLLARRTRLDEYERLVSRGVFGRSVEIARLEAFFDASAHAPYYSGPSYLHAFGPGGIGKSTLVARVALSILSADPNAVLVHFDFDRADLDPLRSATLDLELLRQAGLASHELDALLEERRDRLREQVADEVFTGDDGVVRQSVQQEGLESLSKSALVGALEPLANQGRPLFIILDTFEQIDAGGVQYYGAMRRWLDEAASLSGAPEVRVLVSGRTPPREGAFADASDAELLPIGELSLDGALELLASNGVLRDVGTQIFETFGGNPLVLRLAAELIERVGPDAIAEITADAREGRLPREMVQGLLYDRFLNHIEPPANDYAHPGLVLPEITVELIREVLGPAQGLDPADVPASAVYDALKHATWLVTEMADGRSLQQRRDFRQLLLKLMNSDPQRSASVQRVRDRAIAYHARFSEAPHRAFVLYHQLMMVRTRDDLSRFEHSNFEGVAETLRRHIDDLPQPARIYVQARLSGDIGTDVALEALPDDAWTRYLVGEGGRPGEGDRLVQAADPMIALTLWRRRPVRINGELPLFVLQALVETAEWDDSACEGALDRIGRLERDRESTERLYWLTRLQLLRGKPLSDVHFDLWRRIYGGDKPEHLALISVAEAMMQREVIPKDVLKGGEYASETRVYLVHSTRFGSVSPFRPHLDTLVVLQKDWAERIKNVYLSPFERIRERTRRFFQALFSFKPLPSSDYLNLSDAEVEVGRYELLDAVQTRVSALQGAPLDAVGRLWRELRRRVSVNIGWRAPLSQVLLLRGLTPEFHRPIRQVLCEALTTEAQISGFMERLRPAFSICPADLEPPEFVPRAMRDPANWFLSLVQCADRARIIETLLNAALAEAPGHPKLQRVHDAWIAWDRAIGNDISSDWGSVRSHEAASGRL